MTEAFVYKWTQISTKKWYIGSRTAKGCSMQDGYICSSRIVKPLILENAVEWNREILAVGTPDNMRQLESKMLQQLDAKNDPMSFNESNADGKFSTAGIEPWNKDKKTGHTPWNKGLAKELQPGYGLKHTKENKELFSKNQQGASNSMYGATPWNKGNTGKKWFNNGSIEKTFIPGNELESFVVGRLTKPNMRSKDLKI